MDRKERHGAIIKVSFDWLAEMLDFKGAYIHRVYIGDEWIDPTYFCVVMEHPDLPIVPINQIPVTVTPIMTSTYDENGVLLKQERTKPPKRAVNDNSNRT